AEGGEPHLRGVLPPDGVVRQVPPWRRPPFLPTRRPAAGVAPPAPSRAAATRARSVSARPHSAPRSSSPGKCAARPGRGAAWFQGRAGSLFLRRVEAAVTPQPSLQRLAALHELLAEPLEELKF